jgi:predicted HicB family RNase H-like nuclease
MMEYKGYTAKVEFDSEADLFHGQVQYLTDVITFQGRSVDELKTEFANSVDDYLEFCKERGEPAEKPFLGRFLVRTDPTLHRAIAMAASIAGESLNTWVVQVLRRTFEKPAETWPARVGEGTKLTIYKSSGGPRGYNFMYDEGAWARFASSKHRSYPDKDQLIQKSRVDCDVFRDVDVFSTSELDPSNVS